MGRSNKKVKVEPEFVLFDVIYEDGTKRSNRRVPSAELGGLEGDTPALSIIETQDRELGELSGTPRPGIKSISRSSAAR